jgi:leucyl-tRNA synthetase
MMICTNAFTQAEQVPLEEFLIFLRLLNPFAPHLAEELHTILTASTTMLYHQPWPEFDAEALIENEIELVVQVNGKLRDRIRVVPDATEEDTLQIALASPKILEHTNGKTMRKVIYVQGRLLNLVVS